MSYDAVDVSGSIDLGGLLSINFVDDFETMVGAPDEFEIMIADGGVLGEILSAADGMRILTEDGMGSFQVTDHGATGASSSIVLRGYMPIPEPGTSMLLVVGWLKKSAFRPKGERSHAIAIAAAPRTLELSRRRSTPAD